MTRPLGHALPTVLLLAAGTAAQGQEPALTGLELGGGVAVGMLDAEGRKSWRPEASARIAYGGRAARVFARVRYGAYETDGYLEDDSWSLWSWDLGLRLHLTTASRGWVPYLEGAGALRRGSVEAFGPIGPRRSWELTGEALVLGVGVVILVQDALGIDIGANFTRGWLANPRDDDPWVIYTGALAVGASWWP